LDVVTRALAEGLSRRVSQPIIVENKAGGGTVLATQFVANAPADGYTVLVISNTFTINPSTRSKLPYDSEKDFVAVSAMVTQPMVLLANASFPANTLPELVAEAKKSSSPLQFASTSPGGILYLCAELFARGAGITIQQIPYGGSTPAQVDVIAGRVPVMFDGWYASKAQVAAGKLKVIATVNDKRLTDIPQVPTIAETYPGISAMGYGGLLVRTSVPADIQKALSQAVQDVVRSPEYAAKVSGKLGEPDLRDVAEFGQFLHDEMKKWGEIARAANVKLN
jgi:tripartite-type tricarboxylate transporter receptor subunit TctC